MSTVKDLPEDAPAPRLCHLIKWPDFDGYGFNLHGEKSKPGQYIGKVDKDSPAEMAGLKSNDRIIEVNGTNISNENHKQVVQRIKAISNETKLLVLDEKEDQFYKSLNIVVTSTMPNVVYAKTPVPRPTSTLNNAVNTTSTATTATTTTTTTATVTNGSNGTTKDDDIHHDDHHHHESNSGTETPSDEDNHDKASHVSDSESGSSLPSKNNSLSKKDSRNGSSLEEDVSSSGPSPTPPGSSASPSPTPIIISNESNGKARNGPTLDLNMSVQEMRAKLAAKRKEKLEAKNAKIDLRKKYDIIEML